MLVGVPHHEADGATGGNTFVDAGKKFYGIGFLAGRGDGRLSRPTPVQFLLDKVFVDVDSGRKTVDDTTDGFPVRFSEAGQPENVSESIVVHSVCCCFEIKQ